MPLRLFFAAAANGIFTDGQSQPRATDPRSPSKPFYRLLKFFGGRSSPFPISWSGGICKWLQFGIDRFPICGSCHQPPPCLHFSRGVPSLESLIMLAAFTATRFLPPFYDVFTLTQVPRPSLKHIIEKGGGTLARIEDLAQCLISIHYCGEQIAMVQFLWGL